MSVSAPSGAAPATAAHADTTDTAPPVSADAARGVRTYFWFQFFFSLLLWAPVFYTFHVRMGLTDAEIFRIQSIYYLAFCLFEVPTGYLADTVGYARCLRWGAAVLVAANLLPVAVPTYGGFLGHWLGVALARSLVSGAASAWLYEFLAQYGRPHDFTSIEGRARALGLVGKVVGWAGVGYLMAWRLTLPYVLTAVMAAISWAYATRLPNISPAPSPRRASDRSVWTAVGALLLASPFLVLVILQGVASFVLERIVQVNLFQPLLTVRGLDVEACGLVMAISTLFEAAGSAWPHLLRHRMTDLTAVFLLTAALAASAVGIATSGAMGAVIWLCLFALFTGMVIPIQRQVLNDAVAEPHLRASVMSAESLIDRATCAAIAPMLGAAVARGTTAGFLMGSAGVTLASVVVLLAASRRLTPEATSSDRRRLQS